MLMCERLRGCLIALAMMLAAACQHGSGSQAPTSLEPRTIVLDYRNGWYHTADGRQPLAKIAGRYHRDPDLVAEVNRSTLHAIPHKGQMIYIPPSNDRERVNKVVARVRNNLELIPRRPWTPQLAARFNDSFAHKTPDRLLKEKVARDRPVIGDGEPERRLGNTLLPEKKAPGGMKRVLAANKIGPQKNLASNVLSGGKTPRSDAPADKAFRWPAHGKLLTHFRGGWRNSCKGVEIELKPGTPVRAARAGRVLCANHFPGYGKLVLIDHGDGFHSAYGYNQSILVSEGDRVTPGQTISRAGQESRYSTGKLFFQIRHGGVPVDPLRYLN